MSSAVRSAMVSSSTCACTVASRAGHDRWLSMSRKRCSLHARRPPQGSRILVPGNFASRCCMAVCRFTTSTASRLIPKINAPQRVCSPSSLSASRRARAKTAACMLPSCELLTACGMQQQHACWEKGTPWQKSRPDPRQRLYGTGRTRFCWQGHCCALTQLLPPQPQQLSLHMRTRTAHNGHSARCRAQAAGFAWMSVVVLAVPVLLSCSDAPLPISAHAWRQRLCSMHCTPQST